jgi:hypothetical protein
MDTISSCGMIEFLFYICINLESKSSREEDIFPFFKKRNNAQWIFLRSQTKIIIFEIPAVLMFKWTGVKGCIPVAETHNTRTNNSNEFVEYTKKIYLKTDETSWTERKYQVMKIVYGGRKINYWCLHVTILTRLDGRWPRPIICVISISTS